MNSLCCILFQSKLVSCFCCCQFQICPVVYCVWPRKKRTNCSDNQNSRKQQKSTKQKNCGKVYWNRNIKRVFCFNAKKSHFGILQGNLVPWRDARCSWEFLFRLQFSVILATFKFTLNWYCDIAILLDFVVDYTNAPVIFQLWIVP